MPGIADHYERHAHALDSARRKKFEERFWLDRFKLPLPRGGRVLDLGCGAAEPIDRYLIDHHLNVTGVDISRAMITLAHVRFPRQTWIHGDMRRARPEGNFHGVLAWDSFFHLHQSDQADLLERISEWLVPGGILLFNTEPARDYPVAKEHYHPSLAPAGYRMLFDALGMKEVAFTHQDRFVSGRSVWLVRKNF